MRRFKGWQIAVIIFLGLMMLCTFCLGGSLAMDALGLLPTDTPTGMPTETPTNTASPIPSATLPPTETPTSTPSPLPTETPTMTLTPFATLPELSAAACVPKDTKREIGQVIEVTDGDTIVVRIDDGDYRVRYIGMDTPERDQPFGSEAMHMNSVIVSGQQVTLVKDVSETDQYDRLLRYVFFGDIFVNYELVKQGFANAATYPPDVACETTFREAERAARDSGSGLWKPTAKPTLPPPPPPVLPTQPPPSGGSAVCNCSGNIYNCSAFNTHRQAQACYEYCISQGRGDIHRLDGDNDGSACESLP